jgi:hypothetical protein
MSCSRPGLSCCRSGLIWSATQASVLRVETTINNPREFRIQRWVTNADGRRERRWCLMRKGVSDLWRNYQVGIAANHRYLDALAAPH